MPKLTYAEQLKHPCWYALRRIVFKRDGNKCTLCGKTTNLQCHHLKYLKGKLAWEHPQELLVTLCRKCHEEEHRLKPISAFKAPKNKQLHKKKVSKKQRRLNDNKRRREKLIKTLKGKDLQNHLRLEAIKAG